MKSTLFLIARLLMIEQRYQAIKKSPKFTVEDPQSLRRKLGRFLQTSYIANSASFAVFSFLLITPYIFSGGSGERVSNIGFIVYIYALIISIYSSALFFNAISSMNLLEPVASLPFPGKKKAVALSWFLYSGSSFIFVVLPSTAWMSLETGTMFPIIYGSVWAILFSMLGYSIGAVINGFIIGRGKSDRAGFLSSIKSTLRVFVMLAVFAIFETGIYLPGLIPDFIPGLPYPLNRFVPVFNVPYVVFLGNSSISGILLDAASTLLYLGIFYIMMTASNTYITRKTLETGGAVSALSPDRKVRFSRDGLVRPMFMKEVRIVARKSQNVILLFIPIVFVFPTILSVLIYGSAGGVQNVGTYFAMISILVICSSFYSLIMVVSEGNGIETLFSLPISGRDIVYSKGMFGIIIFSVIIVPVTVLIMGGGGSFSPFDILVPANLILGYSFSSIFNLKRLIGRLPRESSTVNFYSFGGGFFIVFLFITTAAISILPVIVSLLTTELVFGSLNSGLYFFYLFDSIINFIALLMVIGSVGRSDPLLSGDMISQ